jgi:hypothetical protein
MHVDLLSTNTSGEGPDQIVVGKWVLDQNGHAVATGEAARATANVGMWDEAKGQRVEYQPEDGEAYLRALPSTFNGAALRALFVP